MSSKHDIRVKLERDYAITLSEYERAELATETIVGLAALEAADKRIQAKRRVLKEKMARLDYLLRLEVDPEWTPHHIKPLHTFKRERQGEISKATFRVLKSAKEPLRTREIARLVAADLGVAMEERQISKVGAAVYGALKSRLKTGEVQQIADTPVRWLAVKRKWTPPVVPYVFASAPLVRAGASNASPALDASANTPRVRRPGAA
jgi:hypothetical protein